MEEQDWAQVVTAATRAPSIHNTQPWRFVATPDRLEVHLDRARALPVLDPTGRQQVISCGSAVEFAVVALSAAGYDGEVEVLPDDGDPDHLAAIRVTGTRKSTDQERALAGAIARRHTVRAAFQPRAVPADLVDQFQRQAGRYGTWVKPITRAEEEVATVFLISRAEEMEQGDRPGGTRTLAAHRTLRRGRGTRRGGSQRRPACAPVELAHPGLRGRPAPAFPCPRAG